MAVNVKMGVDISSFTSGIKEGQQILKGLNAEMKSAEAEFKATGNAEQMMASKSKTLTSQMNVQKGVIDQANKALKEMTDAGIKPADKEYQKMYATLMQAQAGFYEAQAGLNALSASSLEASSSADKLSTSVQGIGKKISLDQVISGIDRITSGMEAAAKNALQLGERLWDNIMESAQWGDDIATQAMMAQMSVEKYQKVVNVAATNGETSTSSMIKSWKKVKMNLTSDTDDVTSAFKELNIATKKWGEAGQSGPALVARDYMDVWWEIGDALLNVKDAAKQERLAQTLLGRSWQESLPMFLMGREAYEKALNDQDVLTEEQVNSLATLNDTVTGVNQKFDTLKNTLIAEIAPTLTDVAGSIGDLLHEINDYLKTEDGQKLLKDMGDAIGKLFEGLGQMNAQDVVNGFKNVFDKVVNGLEWLANNGDKVISVIEGLGIAWAGLKVSEGALTIVKLVSGLKDLLGIGGAAASGGTLGTTLGSALTAAVGKAAGVLGNTALQNALPGVYDWFTNSTHVGRWITGTEKPQEYFDQVKKNAETFQQDWQNNVIYKFFKNNGENTIKFWDQFWKGSGPIYTPENMEEANWLPSYMRDIKPQIEIQPEPPADANEQIAAAIGVISVPVVLVPTMEGESVNNTNKRLRNIRKGIPGYANGIAYVPDTRLAWLHKGETVRPAREVASHNYSSNLYVENMNMGSGIDARGLADHMAAAQRRQASGYGG